jgi:Aldehyde dehydrogenase family
MPDRRAPREKSQKSSATKSSRKAASPQPGGNAPEADVTRRRGAADGPGRAGAAPASIDRTTAPPRSGGKRAAPEAARRASSPRSGGKQAAAKAGGPGQGANGDSRLAVRKTYKLFIGGAFPRSESGRSFPVTAPDGTLLAHAALASRKDARDAVVAARKAFPGWSGATAYNRGQVLYRVAEMLEGRAGQFADEVFVAANYRDRDGAARDVAAAIDRWVWYAGWPDKVAQIAGGANPVAGPYFNLSVPEPTGVVAVLAPPAAGLLGLASVLAPVIATGNTAVVLASGPAVLAAVSLAEVLATSDVPGGVVNVLTGRPAELAPVLAAHQDVNAIDLTGADPADRADLERLAAGNVKRVFAAGPARAEDDWTAEDWAAAPGVRRLLAFLETKTVWHPVGT